MAGRFFNRAHVPAWQQRGVSPLRAGAIAIVAVVLGTFFAYTQFNPFASPFELEAVFATSQNLEPGVPVRTAGVEVGAVKSVERVAGGSPAARVRLALDDAALPIHSDAELKIRPRLLLEGNSFMDLEPGSPSAPELEDGDVIPVSQTATPVALADVVDSLESGTRENLRSLLYEYGTKALGGSGARNFNRAAPYFEPAYRETGIASEAFLGTKPGDLARLIDGQRRVFGALAREPATLASLVTDLNQTASGFARQEAALGASIPALSGALRAADPALDSLERALPPVRALARDALPGVRSSRQAVTELNPLLGELSGFAGRDELRGLMAALRPTLPALVSTIERSSGPLRQSRAASRCTTQVLVPFSNDTDWKAAGPDTGPRGHSGEPFRQLAPRTLEGLGGESRTADANSPIFHTLVMGGTETVTNRLQGNGEPLFGQSAFRQSGIQPPTPLDDDGFPALPQHRPDVPCEDQEPPELNAPVAPVGAGNEDANADTATGGANAGESGRFRRLADRLGPKLDRLSERLDDGRSTGLEDLNGPFGASTLETTDGDGGR